MRFTELVTEALSSVEELFPWDLAERLEAPDPPMLLDVREPHEFDALHIHGSLNVPRGILEAACEFDYEDTVPALAAARERAIVVMCRSGKRSVLAAETLQRLGYRSVQSLKTGLRGWNDYDQPLVDNRGRMVDPDQADAFFAPPLTPAQRSS